MGAEQLDAIFEELMPRIENYFQSRGYVLVPIVEHEQAELAVMQKKYLRRKALTLKEVVDAQLLHNAKSKSTLERLIRDKKTFKPGEVFPGTDKRKTIKILVSAIKRLEPHWQ